MSDKRYIAIDLKSFYASVECVDRGLDPLTTNLVVADPERSEKTICLAVSPALKAYGIPGRARLFEVVQKVKEINAERRIAARRMLKRSSCDKVALEQDTGLAIDYLIAPPQMARYMEVSTQIYQIYLKYVAPEDIHVYSIDEVFMDVTNYLQTYGMSARELAEKIILDVLRNTGITAAAGIGSNLYLCKVAMDIEAKHIPPNEHGVCIAELDELSYRRCLWGHRPLTDFWRIGRGYAKKLEEHGMYTMGDVARCSVGKSTDYHNEELLYRLFGINAELLIDHAWGWEPCTMADIKAYKPVSASISSGQVLQCPYSADKAKLIVREMTDFLVLDLVEKGLVCDQIVLTVGYDIENLQDPARKRAYRGEVTVDYYGRAVPKHAHGTVNFGQHTSSAKQIVRETLRLFDRIVDENLLVRRINVTANHVMDEQSIKSTERVEQLDLFTDYKQQEEQRRQERAELERERRMQDTVLQIKKKFGKNAILRGTNLEDGSTAINRNKQIGGHKA